MKTTCYVQLVPRYKRNGQFKGLTAKYLSVNAPDMPIGGAFLVRLELTIPDEAFKPTVVSASVPLEKLVPNVTATVS